MADYNPRVAASPTAIGLIDAGLRAYMLRVYNYMLAGLAITGVAPTVTFLLAVTTDPARPRRRACRNGVMLTGLRRCPLRSADVGAAARVAWAGDVPQLPHPKDERDGGADQLPRLCGADRRHFRVRCSYLHLASIAQVFFITAATFGAMSLWGYTTQRDLTGMGSFLFMGLIGIIIASLVGFFVHSSMLQWVISVAGVIIFTGLTAYDTQAIKESYVVGDDGTVMGRKAIFGALRLYLDFINLFLMLLRLMGSRR